ncbi:hypothetical protein PJI17_05245 [Mycobacterium kansasii]
MRHATQRRAGRHRGSLPGVGALATALAIVLGGTRRAGNAKPADSLGAAPESSEPHLPHRYRHRGGCAACPPASGKAVGRLSLSL